MLTRRTSHADTSHRIAVYCNAAKDSYKALTGHWLYALPQLLIVLGWSPLSVDLCWHLLRASVVVDGRSITLLV
jgi:hypothetical protein